MLECCTGTTGEREWTTSGTCAGADGRELLGAELDADGWLGTGGPATRDEVDCGRGKDVGSTLAWMEGEGSVLCSCGGVLGRMFTAGTATVLPATCMEAGSVVAFAGAAGVTW